jgi:hypothetical protein
MLETDDKRTEAVIKKPEGTRSLGRYNYRWQDNIKINIKETGWKDVDWIHLT